MIDLESEYAEIFRMEFKDVERHLEAPHNSLHESYLLGVSTGIVIMATHLGIVLRPDLVEKEEQCQT